MRLSQSNGQLGFAILRISSPVVRPDARIAARVGEKRSLLVVRKGVSSEGRGLFWSLHAYFIEFLSAEKPALGMFLRREYKMVFVLEVFKPKVANTLEQGRCEMGL